MTTDQLESVHKAQPFMPFTLHLVDGTEHDVTNPELMWRTPGGRTIVVNCGGERTANFGLPCGTGITKRLHSNRRQRRR